MSLLRNIHIGIGKLLRSRMFLLSLVVLGLFELLVAVAFRDMDFYVLRRILTRMLRQRPDFTINNGYFYTYWVNYMACLFLVPLFVSAFSGFQVAGEARAGTLRQTLPKQSSRVVYLMGKVVVTFLFTAGVYLGFMGLAYVVGITFFGTGPLVVLPDIRNVYFRPDVLPQADVAWRLVASGLLGAAGSLVLASLGIMLSTMTDNPLLAVIGTLAVYFVGFAASAVPFMQGLTDWLFTSSSDAWMDVFARYVDWPQVMLKLGFCGASIVTFLCVATVVFVLRDVRS